MAVSVVISVRNGEKFIRETIESLLAQGPCVGEIIVADDGSTDDTIGIAKAAGGDKVRIVHATRRGLPAGRNCGAEVATGEWLFFIDADDLVQPGALDRLLAAARAHPEAGIVYGDYDRITHDGRPFGSRRHVMGMRRKPTGNVLRDMLSTNFMVIGAQIVKRSVYEAVGPFDESLKVSDDWNFWCRAAVVTPFLFVPGLYVMSYRVHDTSIIHTAPLPFEAFEPGIVSVFEHPAVRAALPAAELARLRRKCEASKLSYIASVAVRLRHYRTGLRSALRAVRSSPRTSPRTMLQFAGAFVGL